MRLGLILIATVFALVLLTGETPAKSRHGNAGCHGAASCAGESAGCAGAARGPLRGVLKRAAGIRPVRRLLGR